MKNNQMISYSEERKWGKVDPLIRVYVLHKWYGGRLGYYFRSWFTVHESVGSCRKYVKLANLLCPTLEQGMHSGL